jgi:sporulation protein YlmC with PRC-barrel domain
VLRNTHDLIGCTIRATDGDLGSVTTFFFDDERWVIRYAVVDTGNWLPGRKVLISPVSIRKANWAERALEVALTRDQVKGSPDIDTQRPVSRQHETQYAAYYGYPYYWGGPGLWGAGTYPGSLARVHMAIAIAEEQARRTEHPEDSHLRSVEVVTGYHIHATDGEIGHVEQFLIDDASWAIQYIVVDTSNWWGGRRVLVAPSWIRDVSWGDSTVSIDMTRDAIKNSPEYDPVREVSRQYEEGLYSHYGHAGYWAADRQVKPVGEQTSASAMARFARLDDVGDLEVADDDPDVRTWPVVTSDGIKIGRVEHLIVDRPAMKVRYLEVGLDETAIGLNEHRDVLIPLTEVELNEKEENLRVSRVSSTAIAKVPAFTGLPIAEDYDEQFQAATGGSGGTSGDREVRLKRFSGVPPGSRVNPSGRSTAVTSPGRVSVANDEPVREQIVNRPSDERDDTARRPERPNNARGEDEDSFRKR